MGFLVMIAGIYMKGFREHSFWEKKNFNGESLKKIIKLQLHYKWFHESANNNNKKSEVFLVKLFSLVLEAHMIVMMSF